MPKLSSYRLSRRERQIMEVIYQRGRASVAEVRAAMPDPPSYSAVRALLAILVNKGWLKFQEDGPRYAYRPIQPRQAAGRSALRRVMETFFEGSVANTVAALIDASEEQLSSDEMDRLKSLIEQSRKGGI